MSHDSGNDYVVSLAQGEQEEVSVRVTLGAQLEGVELPIRAKVTSCSPVMEKHFISVGSLLDIYSIKSVRAAVLTSPERGSCYILPFDTSSSFSPVYNPSDDIAAATNGYTYSTIEELCCTAPAPLAVFALSGFLNNRYDNSMEAGDVYLIKGLPVYSDNEQLLVCEDASCTTDINGSGRFKKFPAHLKCDLTTDPRKLSLHPSVFFDSMSLPAQVMLTPHAGSSDVEILTVTEIITAQSFILATNRSLSDNNSKQIVMEMFSDVSLELEVLQLTGCRQINLLKFDASTVRDDSVCRRVVSEDKYTVDPVQELILTVADQKHSPEQSEYYCVFTVININYLVIFVSRLMQTSFQCFAYSGGPINLLVTEANCYRNVDVLLPYTVIYTYYLLLQIFEGFDFYDSGENPRFSKSTILDY